MKGERGGYKSGWAASQPGYQIRQSFNLGRPSRRWDELTASARRHDRAIAGGGGLPLNGLIPVDGGGVELGQALRSKRDQDMSITRG